jgi:hypothetical protein
MKKIILTLTTIVTSVFCNAQDSKTMSDGSQTAEGKWLIEANTNFGTPVGSNTNFSYATENGNSIYNIGAEAGYFVIDDLAVKLGLGYGGMKNDVVDTNVFSYKIGAKYYIASQFPVQLDYSGYAWFLGENVSIEPGIRYNVSLNQNYASSDTFQLNLGFALHF